MAFDLSALETQALTIIGGVLLALLSYAAQRLITALNLHVSDQQKQAFEDAANKALQFGIVQAQDMIAQKGWDHVDVKNAVATTAANYMLDKFPDAVSASGTPTGNNLEARAVLRAGILARKFPEVAATMAASPATPPTADLLRMAGPVRP